MNPEKIIKCKACSSELETSFKNQKKVHVYVGLVPLVLFASFVTFMFGAPEPFNKILYSLSAIYVVVALGYFYKVVKLRVAKYGI